MKEKLQYPPMRLDSDMDETNFRGWYYIIYKAGMLQMCAN